MTPATEVKSSGAEEPAAMKVAPATSSDKSSFSEIASNDGTKKSSQIIASAKKQKNEMKIRRLGVHLLVILKYVQTPYSWYNYFFC